MSSAPPKTFDFRAEVSTSNNRSHYETDTYFRLVRLQIHFVGATNRESDLLPTTRLLANELEFAILQYSQSTDFGFSEKQKCVQICQCACMQNLAIQPTGRFQKAKKFNSDPACTHCHNKKESCPACLKVTMNASILRDHAFVLPAYSAKKGIGFIKKKKTSAKVLYQLQSHPQD